MADGQVIGPEIFNGIAGSLCAQCRVLVVRHSSMHFSEESRAYSEVVS